jgi:hypothetical protein
VQYIGGINGAGGRGGNTALFGLHSGLQQFDHRLVSVRDCPVSRFLPIIIFHIGISPFLEQQFDYGIVSVIGCLV